MRGRFGSNPDMDVAELNQRFGGTGLTFGQGPGGLVEARLENARGRARLTLHGGHVLDYQPDGRKPVLWVSRNAFFESGKPIRGGIPVCWPWFADHPSDPSKPAHGVARTCLWNVTEADSSGEETWIQLALHDDEAAWAIWPHAFELKLRVTLRDALEVRLDARNLGQETLNCTAALHSYLAISDIRQIRIQGLEGCDYLDKMDGGARKTQSGPIAIDEETDRIYIDTTADCLLVDEGWKRGIRVSKSGSRSTVVWNPWIVKAQRMADFGDHEHPEMVCIETANAGTDVIALGPSEQHTLATRISVEEI